MFAALGRAVVRRPWWVIASWLVAAAAIVVLAPSLGAITNADQAAFLPSGSESSRAAQLAREAFPADEGASAVVVIDRVDGGALDDTDLGAIAGLAGALNGGRSDALVGVAYDPAGQVAPDRSVALLAARFTGPPEEAGVLAAVDDLRADARDALRDSGLRAEVTGEAAIVADNTSAFAHAERIVTVATIALILVLLLLIFRSPVAALLPLLSVGLVLVVSSALIAAGATALGVEVGQELPTMLTVVLFGIGTDYVLFLLFRYRERLRAGDEPAQAIVAAVERVGEAIFSAAFAVIAAFAALVLAALGFFTTLGPALAVGVAVMLLAALTLAPAAVAVLGRRVFWPSRTRLRPPVGFARLGRVVARRPLAVLVVALVALGGLAAGAVSFRPDFDPINQLPAGTESTRAFDTLQRGFPAGASQPTIVYLRADRALAADEVRAFAGRLAAVDGIATPLAPRTSPDGHTVAVPLLLRDAPNTGAALDLVSGPVRAAARAAAPEGATALVGGQSMAFADVRATTERDLSVIFPVAGLLFVLILAGLLRAALAPAYLVGLVVLGFAATLGATVWVFQGGLGHAGLAFTIPIILYLFVTAIGTDYNILMTARLREEIRDGRSPREAAALAIEHAGPSVAAAAVILAGTFGALLISGVPLFQEIGFAVTLGILLVAFVVSLLLVPALTALAGRAAWWPGRPTPAVPAGAGGAGGVSVPDEPALTG